MSADSPRRIASLQPSATVILAQLGELERVVACTKYCVEVCPEAGAGRAIIADSWTTKTSEIITARPNLVIAAVPYQEKAVSEILRAGIRFLGLAPKTLGDIYTDIATIAGIVAAIEPGERIVREMRQEIETVRAQVAGRPRPTVFCEEWGKPIIASQPWVAELVDAAGGNFVGEPGKQRTARAVLEDDPDVLVFSWCGAGDRVPLQKVVSGRDWTAMRAVVQRRVFCIRDEFLNTPAPTLVAGLRALAAVTHPDRFAEPVGLRRMG